MFRQTFVRVLLCLLLVAAQPVLASRYAYIPKSGASQVVVLDTQTNTVVTNIALPTGTQPWSVAVHPNGLRAYVANGTGNSVSVINTTNNTVIATVPAGNGAYHVAVTPDGSEVWVTADSGGNVTILNAATNAVVATITGLPVANAITFNPAGTRAYISNYTSPGALFVINVQTRALITTLAIGAQSEGLAIHPNGRYVYAASLVATRVSIIDTLTNAVTTGPVLGATRGLAVHPNGRYYYVTQGNTVRTLRTSDNTQVTSVAVAGTPQGIHLTPTGTFAYVSRSGDNAISVFNTVTNAVIGASIATNNAPVAFGLAIQRPLFGHGSIASGQYHSCRVRTDQSVNCWGRDEYGQATAPTTGAFTQVVAGSAHSCGLRTDGTVTCWGNNTYGQTTPASGTFQLLASGARHVCGLRSTGAVACWGENDQGQATAPAGTNFQGIAAGSSHSCALTTTGGITCWGRNTEGQRTVPAGSFVDVVTGSAFTCGLRVDGVALCWGDATGGKTTPPTGPFAKLSAQANYACGVRIGGNVACWGANTQGETVVPGTGQVDVAAGRSHTCALKALGVAQCWGWNLYNQAPQFELNALTTTNTTVGVPYPSAQTLVMSVSNPGERHPYAPRSPAYAVVSGTLPTGMTLSAAGLVAGTPSAAGTFNFTVQGEDANGFIAERAYSIVVASSDASPPVITAQLNGLAGTNGWYRGNVVVTWTVVDAQSLVTSTSNCGPTVVSVETAGQLLTCTAVSAGGTGTGSVTVKLDKTAPTAVPTVSNVRPLLNEVITASANGVDALSGLASETCATPLTNAVSPTQSRITCTVTDQAGNVAVKPASYLVVYGFQGFTDTVVNPGYYNLAPLDQPITFKFQVLDANGDPVTGISSASMASVSVACPAKTVNTVSASESPAGLVDLGGGNYEFTWTTPAAAGCARLNLQLGDGNAINRALFKFE